MRASLLCWHMVITYLFMILFNCVFILGALCWEETRLRKASHRRTGEEAKMRWILTHDVRNDGRQACVIASCWCANLLGDGVPGVEVICNINNLIILI